jgi:hypothetical protein
MALSDVALPPSGDTSWYDHYTELDGVARKVEAAFGPAQPLTGNIYTSAVPVQIDSFAGATDRAKFTAAMAFMAAETRKRPLQFPRRTFASGGTPLLGGNQIFPGLRLYGPGANDGPKNLEIDSGNLVDHRVHLGSGTGTSAFLVGNTGGDIHNFELRNIAFQFNVGGQLVENSTAGSNLYVPNFHALTIYGCTYGIGRPTAKCLMTQAVFSGHWTAVGFSDTLITFGGSDNKFFLEGYLNANSGAGGAGKPIIIFDFVSKTDVGYLYITNEGDWIGIQIKGNDDCHLNFFGGSYEGRNSLTPSSRPVIDILGGDNKFFGIWTAFIDDVANAPGVIRQSGGKAKFYAPVYERSSLAPRRTRGSTRPVAWPRSTTRSA